MADNNVAVYRSPKEAHSNGVPPIAAATTDEPSGEGMSEEEAATHAVLASIPSDNQSTAIVVGDVRVDESSDVIFDNVTLFEGPVRVEKVHLDQPTSPEHLQPDEPSAKDGGEKSLSEEVCGFGSRAFRLAIGLVLLALLVIILTATLASKSDKGAEGEEDANGVKVSMGEQNPNPDIYDGKDLVLVKREEWGAEPPQHPADVLTLPVPFVIISHTAADHCSSLKECSELVRSVQSFHMGSRKWWDIGYNFLVGGDGRAYEARGWDAVGAHALSYNNVSIGLSFMGTFSEATPPQRQLNAAKRLIEEGVRLGKVDPNYALLGHRQVSPTESPGEVLFDIITKWPHWTKLVS